jgi:hypothetical protein
MHQQVEHFNDRTLCPDCIYVFYICLRTNSELCHLHDKLIGFITEMKSVYSAVRAEPLNEALCALPLTVNRSRSEWTLGLYTFVFIVHGNIPILNILCNCFLFI